MSYQQIRPSSFNILPVVIKNLLIINVLFFLADNVFEKQLGFSFNERFGLYFPLSSHFNPIQYVSHLFLHGSFMHIFFNMFALWMFGTVLENHWGPKRFLTFYFITGIGAALIHNLSTWYEIHQLQNTIDLYASSPNMMDFTTLMQKNAMYFSQDTLKSLNDFIINWNLMPENRELIAKSVSYANELVTYKMDVPTVGASGAVFGVLLAFGMLFPNNLLYIYFMIPVKAKYVVIVYGLIELYSGISNNPGDNVAHFAHLGGMLFGFILIKYWNKHDRKNFY